MIRLLESLHYAEITATFQMLEAVKLPVYKGNSLRGSLGYALRVVACTCGNTFGNKGTCAPSCRYGALFETQIDEKNAERMRGQDIPKPFILRPDPSLKEQYHAGDLLYLSVVLVGKARFFVADFLHAFKQMGDTFFFPNKRGHFEKHGIGLPAAKSLLISVQSRCPFDGMNGLLYHPNMDLPFPETLRGLSPPLPEWRNGMCLHFLTPTRIHKPKSQYPISAQDFNPYKDLPVLANRLQMRLYQLATYYCNYHENEKWHDLSLQQIKVYTQLYDFINDRKGRKNDGFLGHLTLKGNIEDWQLLFAFGSPFHVGKLTTEGYGHFEVIPTKLA